MNPCPHCNGTGTDGPFSCLYCTEAKLGSVNPMQIFLFVVFVILLLALLLGWGEWDMGGSGE